MAVLAAVKRKGEERSSYRISRFCLQSHQIGEWNDKARQEMKNYL